MKEQHVVKCDSLPCWLLEEEALVSTISRGKRANVAPFERLL